MPTIRAAKQRDALVPKTETLRCSTIKSAIFLYHEGYNGCMETLVKWFQMPVIPSYRSLQVSGPYSGGCFGVFVSVCVTPLHIFTPCLFQNFLGGMSTDSPPPQISVT